VQAGLTVDLDGGQDVVLQEILPQILDVHTLRTDLRGLVETARLHLSAPSMPLVHGGRNLTLSAFFRAASKSSSCPKLAA